MTDNATAGQHEWSGKTERYFKAWSAQLKCREFSHLEAHQFYKRFNIIAGSVGSCAALATLFTSMTSLLSESAESSGTSAESAQCAAGTPCFALRITGIVFVAVITVVMGIFTFHKPAALAEMHKNGADRFNEIWRRIDLTMLRGRARREAFWPFVEKILDDFEKTCAAVPTTPLSSRTMVGAEAITVGIGSITSLSATHSVGSKRERRQQPQKPPLEQHEPPEPLEPLQIPQEPLQELQPLHLPPLVMLHDNDTDDEDEEAASLSSAAEAAEVMVARIEADNERRFERIRKMSAGSSTAILPTFQTAQALDQRRQELLDSPKPLRWFKKQLGLIVTD